MISICQLDLPAPSQAFIDTVISIVQASQLDVAGKQWLDQQNNTHNSAEHLFFAQTQVDSLMQEEFGRFFHAPVGGVIGIMKNTSGDFANHPPHIDRGRALAINYYLDLGGPDVLTTFYDQIELAQADQSKNFSYQQMQNKKIGQIKFEKNTWYAFDVCRCHSIENITHTRYFVSIFIKDSNYTVQDLAVDYPDLILHTISLDK
jgi:hypothetical protein